MDSSKINVIDFGTKKQKIDKIRIYIYERKQRNRKRIEITSLAGDGVAQAGIQRCQMARTLGVTSEAVSHTPLI
jgi:hypothetical protein